MIKKKSPIFILVAVLTFSHMLHALGDDTESAIPIEPSRFLLRIASEREKLVQYCCRCRVGTNVSKETILSGESKGIKTFVFEYSTIDDHFIVIEYEGQTKTPTKYPKASWSGRSGAYWIGGEDGLSVITPYNKQSISKRYFDIRGIGLGFCGDFLNRTSLESMISSRKTLADSSNPERVHVMSNGSYRLVAQSGDGLAIEFDPKKGLWPVKSVATSPARFEWEINVERHKGFFVPKDFSLVCEERKGLPVVYNVVIDWLQINEPFSLGKKCAARLALEYNATLEDYAK